MMKVIINIRDEPELRERIKKGIDEQLSAIIHKAVVERFEKITAFEIAEYFNKNPAINGMIRNAVHAQVQAEVTKAMGSDVVQTLRDIAVLRSNNPE